MWGEVSGSVLGYEEVWGKLVCEYGKCGERCGKVCWGVEGGMGGDVGNRVGRGGGKCVGRMGEIIEMWGSVWGYGEKSGERCVGMEKCGGMGRCGGR